MGVVIGDKAVIGANSFVNRDVPAGAKAIAHLPMMTPIYAIEYIQNQAGKIRSMTGGQASMPFVLWQDGASRSKGSAAQHAYSRRGQHGPCSRRCHRHNPPARLFVQARKANMVAKPPTIAAARGARP